MTDIEPALTADEWSECTVALGENSRLHCKPRVAVVVQVRGVADPIVKFAGERAVQIMALANAALPDDDPRKITRDDVNALVAAIAGRVQLKCERCGATYDEGDGYFGADNVCPYCEHCHVEPQRSQGLRTLHAKLAALLPP